MNDALSLLYRTARRLCKEKLSSDERYCRLQEESCESWEAFKTEFPHETISQVIDLMDMDIHIESIEAEVLFLMGLQMGQELGALDLLRSE